MASYRLYIDESGDHTYRDVQDLSRRYLGITGVLIDLAYYETQAQPELEKIKRKHFRYDVDDHVVLVRSEIIKRKSHFGVLREQLRNQAWESDLLDYFRTLQAQMFTVVIDKFVHRQNYPARTFDPYQYSLEVLLSRVRGYLVREGRTDTADVMPESRGRPEDASLQVVFTKLRTQDSYYFTAQQFRDSFPSEHLHFRKKEHNIAGLQIADLVAADQKAELLAEQGKPVASPIGPFGAKFNQVLRRMVNRYGRYLLE